MIPPATTIALVAIIRSITQETLNARRIGVPRRIDLPHKKCIGAVEKKMRMRLDVSTTGTAVMTMNEIAKI
jgi:hypothetical protein